MTLSQSAGLVVHAVSVFARYLACAWYFTAWTMECDVENIKPARSTAPNVPREVGAAISALNILGAAYASKFAARAMENLPHGSALILRMRRVSENCRDSAARKMVRANSRLPIELVLHRR